MPVSPEIIPYLTFSLKKAFEGQPGALHDVSWGDSWLALAFRRGNSGKRVFFLCWDPLRYCCTLAPEREIQALLEQRTAALPIGRAVKAHLSGSRMTEIEQIHEDRILRCTFEKLIGAGFVQKKYLLLELTGRYSNCILLEEDHKVLETAKHIHPEDNSYRHILPGHPYSPPPPGAFLSLRDVSRALLRGEVEKLRRARGLGKNLIKHIIQHYAEHSPETWAEALEEMKKGDFEGFTLQEIQGELTVFPMLLPEASEIPEGELFSRLWKNSGGALLRQSVESKKKKLSREIRQNLKRTRHQIRGMEERLERAQHAELWKKKGQLLLGSPGEIPRGASSVELEDWEHPGTTLIVELKETLGVSANAERYFKKYKKARGSVEETHKKLESLRQQEEEEDTLLSLLESCESLEELRAFEAEAPVQKTLKKKREKSKTKGDNAPSRPYLELDLPSLGGHIYLGMNTRGNRRVTFDLAKSGDLWFHAQKIPGAHVILRSSRSEHHPEAIALAASLAAFYSKGKNSLALPVDYAPVQHVKHIPGKGIAHVRYTNFSTLRSEPKSLSSVAAEYAEAPDPGDPERT
ncbi:MAG TPA: NFACT family protein [Synergistaceae bacterium]|mgnify:CR=1 FL=1|nr:NFACT family protein [Synergistaceae bacterium]HPQ36566.1 NFACT family protein [Synergistaceae bacterium]